MEYVLPLIFIVVVAICIWAAIATDRRQRKRKAQMVAEARTFMEWVELKRALPTVGTNIILKPGEVAFYSAPSALYETRAVRHYHAGHAGFRVAKGVYIGGTRGLSTSTQVWSKIGTGYLTVTNKRLVFSGGGEERAVQLNKIVSVQPNQSGIELSAEGRDKSMRFEAANPLILAAIIQICCRTEDPRDLSQTELDISFVE